MRESKRQRWVMMGLLMAASLPKMVAAADSSLEDRVRALERKLDMQQTQQKQTETETQSVRQRVEAIETEVKTQEQTIADKLGINFHAFVDTLYLYNFNNPQNRTNQLRVFDVDSNSFTLQQANLNISRKKAEDNFGFLLNVDFGLTAEAVGNATQWGSNPNPTRNDPVEVREAYVTYRPPFDYLNTVTLKAGKFVTLLGAEIINNYDNFNYNISRSLSFGFGINFTNTGVMANFPIGSMVSIDAGVVNGWDTVFDNNSGKTFLGGVGFTPLDMYSFYLSGTYGPEEQDNGHSKRGVFTWVHTLKLLDTLTLIAEATYGNESQLVPPNNDSALWYGGAGYIVYKPTDRWTAALRVEGFDDSDGARFPLTRISGTKQCASAGFGDTPLGPDFTCPVTAWEITPTVAYQLTSGLLWRAEFREDEADKKVFQRPGGNYVSGQSTLATELIYVF